MTITSGSVRGAVTAMLFFGLGVLGACGGSSKDTKSQGTTPKQGSSQPAPAPEKKDPPPMERDAVVTVRENMFPPVDAGAWVCEPKSWNEQREARMHCTAPAGSDDLIAALKALPEVVSAEPAN